MGNLLDQNKPINTVGSHDKDLGAAAGCKLSDRANEGSSSAVAADIFDQEKNSDKENSLEMESISGPKKKRRRAGSDLSGKSPSIQLHMDSVESEENNIPFRTQSRSKVLWTREETNALIRHVETHGFQWRRILDENQTDFSPSRRIIDLKNKYNMITKSNTFYTTPKRNWVEIVDGEPRRDSVGEVICVIDKFPYNAAKKLAKAQRFSGYESYTMYIADEADLEKLHVYIVTVTQDTYNVKKMKRESE